jgi:tetratricopeptide (TPR) repeat protein
MDSSRTWLHSLLAPLVALAVLVAPLMIPTAHAQDARAKARTHYQKGNQLYSSGDYQSAIAEFAAADKLAPSPMLEFNIALCYDQLGDRAEALRRYRLYLKAMPNAANRSTVEGKIRRLEGELRTEAEARRKAREAEAAKAAAAAAAAAAKAPPAPVPTPAPVPGPDGVPTPTPAPTPDVYNPGATPAPAPAPVPAPAGPATAAPADPQLARVAAIDVAAIRDQRRASGYGNTNQYGKQNAYGGNTGAPATPPAADDAPKAAPVKDSKKASKPLYKQWWFWVVVGVSTLILIDFATSDSSSTQNSRFEVMPGQTPMATPGAGPLEWRF